MVAVVELRIKRIYEPPSPDDGLRILIDRLWPRGLAKARAQVDFWARDLAPSTELRRWFDHREERWPEFRRRYFAELDEHADAVAELRSRIGDGPATICFASREARFNNATALQEYLADS